MDRDVFAKIINLVKAQEEKTDRINFDNANFTGLALVSTTQNRITFTFEYPEDFAEDHIKQLVLAPAYIRIDSILSGELVSKQVALS